MEKLTPFNDYTSILNELADVTTAEIQNDIKKLYKDLETKVKEFQIDFSQKQIESEKKLSDCKLINNSL